MKYEPDLLAIRPVSFIGTYNQKLAKFLAKLLDFVIPK